MKIHSVGTMWIDRQTWQN